MKKVAYRLPHVYTRTCRGAWRAPAFRCFFIQHGAAGNRLIERLTTSPKCHLGAKADGPYAILSL